MRVLRYLGAGVVALTAALCPTVVRDKLLLKSVCDVRFKLPLSVLIRMYRIIASVVAHLVRAGPGKRPDRDNIAISHPIFGVWV